MAGWARPVRMTANSSLATVTALSIFSSASKSVSSIMFGSVYFQCLWSLAVFAACLRSERVLRVLSGAGAADQRADLLAADGPDHVPLAHEREHHDRQSVVHAQADRRGIHYLQLAAEVLAVVESVEARRVRRGVGIRVIDPVDLGALEDRVGADL